MGEARRRREEIAMLKAMTKNDPMISIRYDPGELGRGSDIVKVRRSVVEKYRDEGIDAAIVHGSKTGQKALADITPEFKLMYEYTLAKCLIKMTALDEVLPEEIMHSAFVSCVDLTEDFGLSCRFAYALTRHMMFAPVSSGSSVESPRVSSFESKDKLLADLDNELSLEERREMVSELILLFEGNAV